MAKKFDLFKSTENEGVVDELTGGEAPVETMDENELVAGEIVEATGDELSDVSEDTTALSNLDNDIDGLEKDIEIAETAIEETGIAPEATIESIRLRIKKANERYGLGVPANRKHFSKENYTSVVVAKSLSVAALEDARRSLKEMIGGFFKGISNAFARTFKVLENIDKGANEMIQELNAVKSSLDAAPKSPTDAGNAKWILAKGNIWKGFKVDADSLGELVNRNVKATNQVNGTHMGLRDIIKQVAALSTSPDIDENSKGELDKLRAKVMKYSNQNFGTAEQPLAGCVYVEMLEFREDLQYDKGINVGKAKPPKGEVSTMSAPEKTLVRMIDTVVGLLESTKELYKEFLTTIDKEWETVTVGRWINGDNKTKEGRAKMNHEFVKRIVSNVASFIISYMNKAVGNVGQSNLTLGKMVIAYANASVKAGKAEANAEETPAEA